MTKSKFQTHCEELIKKLTRDKVERFNSLADDLERIKFVYSIVEEVKFDLAAWQQKDFERAEVLKTNGNKLFQNRNNFEAVALYNEGITRCPQDNLEGEKLYAILIANRSAVFFDNAEYEKVLQDIAFLKQYGHHPNLEKLLQRETKAIDAICAASKSGVIEFEADGSIKSQTPPCEELTWVSKNITYPHLSNKLMVKKDSLMGRYIVAKSDFQPGEIIAIEKPYASVITGDIYRTNCAHCTVSTNRIQACPQCCQAVYCSLTCLEHAKNYHQYECAILLTLFDARVSVNNLLALRMITQRPLSVVIKEEQLANEDRNVVIYKTEDYYNVRQLVCHDDVRGGEELLHLTVMASFLLKLLKKTQYCKENNENNDLSEEEITIGGLLLKYLQILQYNAHEIFELQNLLKGDKTAGNGNAEFAANYKTGDVGAGVYTTLALFNHSCDPSVIRYNIKNTMILRSIKPIKAGDIVYENYGPLYMCTPKIERQNKMAAMYRFNCACQACVEDWPVFNDMNPDILRILCDCGAVIPTNKEIPTPSVTCKHCNNDKNLFPVLTGLIPVGPKSADAEDLFAGGHFADAANLYADLLVKQLRFLAPPFGDMVQMQQRLKICLLHRGNKKFNYRPL